MNAKNNRNALPTVQGYERCDADKTGGRCVCKDTGVFQLACIQDQGSRGRRAKTEAINWNEWNPFERATGEALRQLNRRQRKPTELDGEEALL